MSGAKGKEPIRHEVPPEIAPGLVSKRASEIDVTEGLRTLVMDSNDVPTPHRSSLPAPAVPGSPMKTVMPKIMITPPSVHRSRNQPSHQLGSDFLQAERPKLRKAATAPPGVLLLSSMKPQPPRRAISARSARSNMSRRDRLPRNISMGAPLPQLSHYGSPASRSVITRRKTIRKSGGRSGLKPKVKVWRLSSPSNAKVNRLLAEALNNGQQSFSHKARVKQTLENKNMDQIKTNFSDFKSKGLPTTPSSMMSTPRELYGERARADSETQGSELSESYCFEKHRSLHLPASPTKAKHVSLPVSLDTRYCQTFERSNPATNIHMMEKREVYIPGEIRLEEKTTLTPRRGSIATMEPFDSGTEPRVKRFSDMVVLDAVVMYFQSLGIMEQASEECLDKFWVPDMRTSRQLASPRRAKEVVPPTSCRQSGPTAPSSSTSTMFPNPFTRPFKQGDKQPPSSPTTPTRPRIKLRRLLNSSRSIL